MGEDLQKKIFAQNLTYFLNLNGKKQIDLSNELGIGLYHKNPTLPQAIVIVLTFKSFLAVNKAVSLLIL